MTSRRHLHLNSAHPNSLDTKLIAKAHSASFARYYTPSEHYTKSATHAFTPTYPMSPLISVIVPVFDVAPYLERCLDSILTQTYSNLEIILIDDGSTDGSEKLCDDFAQRDPRIKVIHQANRGLSGARNSGLKAARGNYVTFIDSDDTIQPALIETLLDLCRSNLTNMSICAFREVVNEPIVSAPTSSAQTSVSNLLNSESAVNTDISSQGTADSHLTSHADSAAETTEILNTLDCLTRMLCEQGFSMSAWGKLYARKLFAHVKFPESRLYEDVGTTYRLVMQCPKIAVSSMSLYNYYINPGSITQQHFTLHKLDLIDLTDQMCDDIMQWAQSQPSASREHLANLTKKRRMHARFSILRQTIMVTIPKPVTVPQNVPALQGQTDQQSFLLAQNEIVQYLRGHKQDILQNPLASRRDRLAMYSLLLGLPVFKFAWRVYDRQKHAPKTQNFSGQPKNGPKNFPK